MVSSAEEVQKFLDKAISLLKSNKFQFIKRQKNLNSMNEHGLSIADVKFHIESLTTANYYKGPKEDIDRSGKIWEFGTEINDEMFYIKLKIKFDKLLCCISFHGAQYGIDFPYRGNKRGNYLE